MMNIVSLPPFLLRQNKTLRMYILWHPEGFVLQEDIKEKM